MLYHAGRPPPAAPDRLRDDDVCSQSETQREPRHRQEACRGQCLPTPREVLIEMALTGDLRFISLGVPRTIFAVTVTGEGINTKALD